MKWRNKGKVIIRASLTVEATLVLLVIMTVYIVFLSMFQIMYAELELTAAAAEAVEETAGAGYLYKHIDALLEEKEEQLQEKTDVLLEDAGELEKYLYDFAEQLVYSEVSEQWFRAKVEKCLTKPEIIEKIVDRGYRGVSFVGSEVYAEDEMTVVQMAYQVKFPVLQHVVPPLKFHKTVIVRSFSGEGSLWESASEEDSEEGEDTEEGYVFVTESGTVYHQNRNCTYISIKTRETSFDTVGEERNRYGAKYYPCEGCASDSGEHERVWITESGNRYHTSESCSKLKRTVKRIEAKEAEGYRPCSKCGGTHVE